MRNNILDLATLLRVPYVEPELGFDISPDGAQIAFSWNPTGQWEIYLVPSDGSTLPRKVTTEPGGKFNPRWSPDGCQLAYVLDLDGGELYDVYLYNPATGHHTNLNPDTPDALQPNFQWSPDSSQIAFISDRSGSFNTYVMPATGGSAHLVLDLPHPDWDVQWSPDGHWLAVVVEAVGQDYWTVIVPVEGGEPYIISDAKGPINAKDARWSPDSTRIAFSSDVDGIFNVGIYELETRQITWVTQGKNDGDKEQPTWSPDGKTLVYTISDGPVMVIAVQEIEGDSRLTYQVEPGVYYRPQFTPDGTQLAFVFDNPRYPDDLWLFSINDGSFQQLTQSLPSYLQDSPFVIPTAVRYPGLDDVSVPALLYKPLNVEGPPPAVVYIHGGPTWLSQVTWDPLVQHMVSRGWIVLAPNYRGSTGYGKEWQLANRFDMGGCDTRDVVAGADYLVREGLADASRIAVTGTSWGGYLTMTSLTQYSDRWAAGSAVVPFLNWFTGHANSREDLQHWDLENFGDPEKDYDLYYERSPFFFLDRITAPVQMICGAHDVRCPASESIQARDELFAQGKVCDLVLYQDEGHGFLKTENVVDAKKRRVAFLAGALEGNEPQPIERRIEEQ